MNKTHKFPTLLSISVRQTISHDSPSPKHTDYYSDWYTKYSSTPYNTSIFFKGPLLYTHVMTETTELNNVNSYNPESYKRTIKAYLMKLQSTGDTHEWCSDNFLLTNLPGLRKSARYNSK